MLFSQVLGHIVQKAKRDEHHKAHKKIICWPAQEEEDLEAGKVIVLLLTMFCKTEDD
jgi:hypothetical protein